MIILRLDRVMADRKMSLNDLAANVGISNVNLCERQPFQAEDRKGQRGPLLHPERDLQSPALPAGGYPGIR